MKYKTMGNIRVGSHAVSHRKDRLIAHIKEYGQSKGICIGRIHAHKDYVHRLLSVKPDQAVAKTMYLISGESFYWLNREQLNSMSDMCGIKNINKAAMSANGR